jgi:hypothetical protein
MKILVSMASYGSKNLDLLNKVIDEYKSYKKYDVTINIHCTVPLKRDDVNFIVYDNPKTTIFFHRDDFIQNQDKYDLFLFGEYDMLIKESTIDTYIEYDKHLPIDYCPGFIRYENTPENIKYLIDLWLNISSYHYIKDRLLSINEINYFTLTNVHQAAFLLSKEKLHYIIQNTEFMIQNTDGLWLETSSSGIFSSWQNGPRGIINKVIPLNKKAIQNLLIHHTADCHCNPPGVNHHPMVFRSNTVTENQLLDYLDL